MCIIAAIHRQGKPMSEYNWPFIHGRGMHISRADGIYLYDRAGEPIIDAAGGAIVANIGHGRQRVVDAVSRATAETSYVVPTWTTPGREAMLEQLADWLPAGMTRVHGTSGGTEANEAALKIALHYQQAIGAHSKTEIIGRTISYHGTSLSTTSLSGHPARKRGLEAALPNFHHVETPYPLRCDLGTHGHDCGHFYADMLRDAIEQLGPEHVAAFVAEPITGSSGGAIVPPDGYWQEVRAICDEFGVLLVLDEVMTGFGRTGKDFGYQHWDITPDIIVGGKGMAGGYAPLGGVFAKEDIGLAIADAGYPVMFNTFGAHPAACAASAEVLKIMREEDLVARAATQGEYLSARLQDAFSNHPNVAEVRGRGLLSAIEVVVDRESLERFPLQAQLTQKIVAHGLKRGVFFYAGGTGDVRDIVCMGPPFVVEETDIDTIVSVLLDSVDAAVSDATKSVH